MSADSDVALDCVIVKGLFLSFHWVYLLSCFYIQDSAIVTQSCWTDVFLFFVNKYVKCLPSKHSLKVQYSPNGSVGSKPQQCGGAHLWCEGREVMHFP